jgi:hypothetical protein
MNDLATIQSAMIFVYHFSGRFGFSVEKAEDAAEGHDMMTVRPYWVEEGPYLIQVPTLEELERSKPEDQTFSYEGATFGDRIHTNGCLSFLRRLYDAMTSVGKAIGVFSFRLGICGVVEIETKEDVEWVILPQADDLKALEIILPPHDMLIPRDA